MSRNNDIIEVEGQIFAETDAAYLFSDGSNNRDGSLIKVWLPKSQCEWEESAMGGTMQIPEWLAQEKGLL